MLIYTAASKDYQKGVHWVNSPENDLNFSLDNFAVVEMLPEGVVAAVAGVAIVMTHPSAASMKNTSFSCTHPLALSWQQGPFRHQLVRPLRHRIL